VASVNPYHFTNEGDQWVLRPENYVVAQICVDYGVMLNIGTDSPALFSLVIASPFSFMDGGKIHAVDVGGNPLSGSTLLALRMRPILEVAIAIDEGVLHIRFAGDASIVVEADRQYEAWQLGFSEAGQNLNVVCTPGGELAIWSPVE
jgi:hypothetical protein